MAGANAAADAVGSVDVRCAADEVAGHPWPAGLDRCRDASVAVDTTGEALAPTCSLACTGTSACRNMAFACGGDTLSDKEKAEREKQRQLQEEREVEEAAYSAIGALVGRIGAKVRQNWNKPPGSMAGLETVISVKVQRTGEVVSVKVVKSSGNVYFDQSAENAVYKASPLPFPDEPRYYEFIKEFNFKFVPDRN